MKKIIKIFAISLGLLLLTNISLMSQKVTEAEALNVASNWITLIQHNEGSWGGCEEARVEKIEELSINDRQVGYYCQVEPDGFILVSLYKGLAPVKACATLGKFDVNNDQEQSTLLKQCMENVISAVEEQVGPIEDATNTDLIEILEVHHQSTWDMLNINPTTFRKQLASGSWDNYQSSDILLETAWAQWWPYNKYSPNQNCNNPGYNGNVPAGCAPVAAAQVMKYWNWPPFYDDEIDWLKMPESIHSGTGADTIHEVAELIYEIGDAVMLDWGCDGSTAFFANNFAGPDLLDAFEDHFQYNDNADVSYRPFKTQDQWWDIIKEHLNLNRPLPYQIYEHVIVADGWRVVDDIRQYHMNWGHGYNTWGTPFLPKNMWYTLDELPTTTNFWEAALTQVYPEYSIGVLMNGPYIKDGVPYRYFDQDATGFSATFYAGQKLQFLQNIFVMGAGTDPSQKIILQGSAADPTLLFSQGDQSKGVRIKNGSIKLRAFGSIGFKKYNY
nr:C10 family peptidase [Bacteroidota bacterium]